LPNAALAETQISLVRPMLVASLCLLICLACLILSFLYHSANASHRALTPRRKPHHPFPENTRHAVLNNTYALNRTDCHVITSSLTKSEMRLLHIDGGLAAYMYKQLLTLKMMPGYLHARCDTVKTLGEYSRQKLSCA